MTVGDEFGLNPDAYWEKPDESMRVGDVFADVPLLSRYLRPIMAEASEDRLQAYLPTTLEPALLFRKFPDGWWFLPVVTSSQFSDVEGFQTLLRGALSGSLVGWYGLAPLRGRTVLSDGAVVYVQRPTVHRPVLFEDVKLPRIATLTGERFVELCESFTEALAPQ
ncbi:MAG: hypothetical protein M3540_12715 [Actinomycetota bacterium]|nr:hypothetical protein [Actinomycetota bacterium]